MILSLDSKIKWAQIQVARLPIWEGCFKVLYLKNTSENEFLTPWISRTFDLS